MLKARKRTLDKEENTTERRQKVVRRRNWCRDCLCQTDTNSDTNSPKMKQKKERKTAQVAACLVFSNMEPGPRKVRTEMASQHRVYSWQDGGQPEQTLEKRPLSH